MASVLLLSAAPEDRTRFPHGYEELDKLRELASRDRFGIHGLTDEPAEAEVILFVESTANAGPYFERVRRHPVYRRWRSKCFLFSSTDRVVPLLPGIYASIERRWYWPAWTRSGGYLGIREGGELRYRPDAGPRRYLFSFVGSSTTHRVRRRLVRLGHPEALLIDTSAESRAARPPQEEYRRRYAQSIAQSAFVLCPRGGGASTFRLFETMMLGRPPVIVSDQWVPPSGPDWGSFSIRVAERDLERLPGLLEDRRAESETMGEAARAAWNDWFSESACFHRTVGWCLELAAYAPAREGVRSFAPYLQMARPFHAARWSARRLGHGERWRVPRPLELVGAATRLRNGERS
jgi:hypothetical protein